jgi:hypothetical protein
MRESNLQQIAASQLTAYTEAGSIEEYLMAIETRFTAPDSQMLDPV